MLGKFDSSNRNGGDSGGGQLLQELEALSKALYQNPLPNSMSRAVSASKSHPNPLPNSMSGAVSAGKSHQNPSKPILPANFHEPKTKAFRENPSLSKKEAPTTHEKKGLWNWKPLRALAHIRNRRFMCNFTLQVHSVEGLSSNFNGSSLCVHWRRNKDVGLMSKPSKVFHGVAEFEEVLSFKSSVYGSGGSTHHRAKYEPKNFVLYVSVVGYPQLDLGKHRIDLTRLLPETLDELEGDKSSGSWTTNFKLSGKARGAILIVTFGFSVLTDDLVSQAQSIESGSKTSTKSCNSNVKFAATEKNSMSSRTDSGFDFLDGRRSIRRFSSIELGQSGNDAKILNEVLPSFRMEYLGLGERGEKLSPWDTEKDSANSLVDSKRAKNILSDNDGSATEDADDIVEEEPEFNVIEQGVEISQCAQAKVVLEDTTHGIPSTEIEKAMVGSSNSYGVSLENQSKPEESSGKCPSLVLDGFECDKLVDTINEEVASIECDKLVDSLNGEEASVECDKLVDALNGEEASAFDDCELQEKSLCIDESVAIEELNAAFASPKHPDSCAPPIFPNVEHKVGKHYKSRSLDDITESVASEFLSMLGLDHGSPFRLSSDSDSESPRERLWKQFEKDSLTSGNVFDLGMGKGKETHFDDLGLSQEFGFSSLETQEAVKLPFWESDEELELSSILHAAETEHQKAAQTIKSKTRAKMLEDAETEALMRQWGMDEKAFRNSPPNSSGGFGSPINLPPEEPLELPPLGDGLGPLVQTKDGGFVRSMSPSLFKNCKNSGSLVMQVSSPVVVPAEMGSGVMEILQGLASVGIEKLTMQAKKLMPLEDITGKTMPQVAWEAVPALEERERHDLLHGISEIGFGSSLYETSSGRRKGSTNHGSNASPSSLNNSEYVSLEDLAPFAMEKIEALSMEGLKIQSGMAEEDAPSNISPQSFGEISAFEGTRAKISGSLGLEGTGGLQLLDIKETNEPIDGLMGLSITLDEWMRLDSGIIDEDQASEKTSKILAAHHATCTDMIMGGSKGRAKGSGKRWGFLGNTLTVALLVQLRDPLRNYEAVGAPMLALIQAERVLVPPKAKIYCSVSEKGNSEEIEEPKVPKPKEEKKDEELEKENVISTPQFKITEVHVAGLKTAPGKGKLWGSETQKQSGSRWLLASGMGKTNKNSFMTSKVVSRSSQQPASKSSAPQTKKVKAGDTLWSISSRIHGNGSKWKELPPLKPHIRNPNVILPNEKFRLG
ncbi:hypothetical protein AMTRI_Chr05g63650 [Amborella trichopoda]